MQLKRDDAMQKEKLIQNLKDCDCDSEIINEFMSAIESGSKAKALRLLSEHREELLDKFHRCDNCISCLDYLVNQLESEV